MSHFCTFPIEPLLAQVKSTGVVAGVSFPLDNKEEMKDVIEGRRKKLHTNV